MDTPDLEALLVAVLKGETPRAALLDALAGSFVAVLLDKGLDGAGLHPQARPLALNTPEGDPVLAVFTSVEKAAPWAQKEPAYAHALRTGFAWPVHMAPEGVGIALNPGYRWSLVLAAAEVQALKTTIR